jgi:DNA-binding CsgD family transcriptional regulator
VLVGRAAEGTGLRRRLARARRGKGGATLIIGEPGVGKTALIREVFAPARAMKVLHAVGVESEASLGFSVLAELCRPLLGLLERIPERQAAALSGALALGPVAPLDPFAAYAGALSLLAAAAERQPLLVCVDDAHWMDVESARALAFCARRIYAEPILMVLAAREGEPLPFPSEAFEVLALGGLDAGGSAALLAVVRGGAVEAKVSERLHAATAGNPLALIELVSLLSEAQLSAGAALEEPLPVGAGIERLFWRQIARQPAAVQSALLVAAASDSGSVEEVARALPAVGLSIDELEVAEAAGLVNISKGRLEFKHPLLRSVVYRAAAARDRRAVHRALAETISGHDARLRRAWHRARATPGTDESVARELEQAGTQMAARTGYAAAASALERAAELSEDDEPRARRLLAAANAACLAGMLDGAAQAARGALGRSDDPRLQAECTRLLANLELYAGDVLAAHRMLVEAAERIAPFDPAREAQLLIDATLGLCNAGEVRSARQAAERAHQRASEIGGGVEVLARKWLGGTLILNGEGPLGYQLMSEGLEREAQHGADLENQLFEQVGALCAMTVEDYDRARRISQRLVSALRAAGALTPLPYTLAALSELEFRTGNWAAALANASEAVTIAEETGQGGTAAFSLVSLARVEAAIGREQAAREHADRGLMLGEQAGAGSIPTYARAALGLLELGLSRPEYAREQLAPLPELTRRQGLAEPGVVCWQPDWIEANVRLGELESAQQALARLELEARTVKRTWALAAAARYRGLIAPDHQFDGQFAKALNWHQLTPTPFDRARTQLCYGERLRRTGQRRRAREQLQQALETFHRLGAGPWARQAQNELSATGATRTRAAHAHTAPPPQQLLTAQELQVALTVAEGKSNKEAAAALFLSPKTIEFHLGHIYSKLDLHTRTQLARKMLTPREDATPAPAAATPAPGNDPGTAREPVKT